MEFTHFDEQGNARMVDVSEKEITHRVAVAEGAIAVSREVMDAIKGNKVKKGDVLTVAQIAGIMGTKRTSELIPMCHPLSLTNAAVTFEVNEEACEIKAVCRAVTDGFDGGAQVRQGEAHSFGVLAHVMPLLVMLQHKLAVILINLRLAVHRLDEVLVLLMRILRVTCLQQIEYMHHLLGVKHGRLGIQCRNNRIVHRA